jgi:hypothetical protein
MRFVSAEEIRRVLTLPALIAAMEAGHRRPRMEARDLVLGEEQALYFVRSAVDRGTAIGSKLFTSFPATSGAGGRRERIAGGAGRLRAIRRRRRPPARGPGWHRDHVVEDGRRFGARGPSCWPPPSRTP